LLQLNKTNGNAPAYSGVPQPHRASLPIESSGCSRESNPKAASATTFHFVATTSR